MSHAFIRTSQPNMTMHPRTPPRLGKYFFIVVTSGSFLSSLFVKFVSCDFCLPSRLYTYVMNLLRSCSESPTLYLLSACTIYQEKIVSIAIGKKTRFTYMDSPFFVVFNSFHWYSICVKEDGRLTGNRAVLFLAIGRFACSKYKWLEEKIFALPSLVVIGFLSSEDNC